jgi:hypothetical protein
MHSKSSGKRLRSRVSFRPWIALCIPLFLYITASVNCEPDVNSSPIEDISFEVVALNAEDSLSSAGPDAYKTVDVFVYVINRDDDRLSVSLFIDSELIDTEDISKDNELKFGSYPLTPGPHSFKISWWDDDTKTGYNAENIEDIISEGSVILYTSNNQEPEKFEVSVNIRNEDDKNLDAYLYIDGEYEKRKDVKKESTTDFGEFDLEEGIHEFRVMWQDPDTGIEYEKRKTVSVDGKEVVVFYAPKGIVFKSDSDIIKKSSTEAERSTASTSSVEAVSDNKSSTSNK